MSEHKDPHAESNDTVKFEATDIATRPIVVSVGALAIFTLVFTFVAHLTFKGLASYVESTSPPASPLAAEYAAKQPPEPRLQLDPKKDLEVLHAYEEKTLGTLAWVDKNAGIVQVPIERAMEILLTKGLPARQGPVPAKMSPQGVAPSQGYEASGAPDWFGGAGIGHEESAETEGGHAAGGHAKAPSHEAPAEAHGH